MTNIQYLAPTTLDEAVSLYAAAAGSARILAGGTDLLVQLRSGMINPGIIIDIKKILKKNQEHNLFYTFFFNYLLVIQLFIVPIFTN